MDSRVSQCTPHLTSLPAEIRVQIYAHLFEDWTLCVSRSQKPPRSKDDPHEADGGEGGKDGRPEVRAIGFPSAIFHVCRSMYCDLAAMRPFPLETLQIDCFMNLASDMRCRLGLTLEEVQDRVDWTRARKVLVNQEGVHAIDVELVKRRMERLSAVEVILRDVDVNAQYAPGWVSKALDRDSSVVNAASNEAGWESSEFAFGYLHSFLGWRHPMPVGMCIRKQAKLLARQHVSVWSQRKCIASVDALHDIETRRIVRVTKLEVDPGWRELLGQARAPLQTQPVPFFEELRSADEIQTKPGWLTSTFEV